MHGSENTIVLYWTIFEDDSSVFLKCSSALLVLFENINNLMSIKHCSISYTNYSSILVLAFYEHEVHGILEHL